MTFFERAGMPKRRRFMFRTASMAMLLGVCPCLLAAAEVDVRLTPFSSAALGDPPAAWQFATLPRKVPTRFSIVELGDARVLKVQSDESYGNLVYAVKAALSPHSVLQWRWRVDKLVDGADLKTRDGDDSAAKLCVFFAFDASRLSLGERTKLSIARSRTGQDVPAQTLCYVWDNKLPIGTGMPNAFTRRLRFIVLQSGTAKLGQWMSQRREIVADYQRMFGDESEGTTPEATGVAVSADADNTHGHGLSYFGDISLEP